MKELTSIKDSSTDTESGDIELESITDCRLSCRSEDVIDVGSTKRREAPDVATSCVDMRDPKTAYQLVILICAILLIITLLQIPTILYYVNSPSVSVISSFGGEFDVDLQTCSVGTNVLSVLSGATLDGLCPDTPLVTAPDDPVQQLCLQRSVLLAQSVFVVSAALQNDRCNSSALPFFCNASDSLCGEDGAIELSEECVRIRDNDCAIEWRLLENFINVSIPDCQSFTEDGNLTFSRAPPLTCPDQFDLVCDTFCLPVCSEFSQLSHTDKIVGRVLQIISQAVGILGGIITLIACILKRKTMFRFPQIYIVYNTINVIIILTFLMLPLLIGPTKFLCSDHNLLEALETPTRYCLAQGFILQSGFLYFFGFWLFHLTHLFYALSFPLKAKMFMENHAIKCHVIEVAIVLVLGSLPGAIIAGTSGYQIDRFPPDVCVPVNPDVFFYTFLLPIALGATLGLCMLITTFWILRRMNAARSQEEYSCNPKDVLVLLKNFCTGFSTPETKLFALFWYYVIVIVVLLTHFTEMLQTADSTVEQIQNYITCSIAGYRPECDVHQNNLEDSLRASYYLDITALTLVCSVTLSNLTYVLPYYDIKKFLLRIC